MSTEGIEFQPDEFPIDYATAGDGDLIELEWILLWERLEAIRCLATNSFACNAAHNHRAKVEYYTLFNGDVIVDLLIIFMRSFQLVKKIFLLKLRIKMSNVFIRFLFNRERNRDYKTNFINCVMTTRKCLREWSVWRLWTLARFCKWLGVLNLIFWKL